MPEYSASGHTGDKDGAGEASPKELTGGDMAAKRYSIGIDFGTESARAVLVDVVTGKEVATSVYQYKDGVIDERLPAGRVRLGADWALQNPSDYIEAVRKTVPDVVRKGKVKPEYVVGIGTDFTSCTMMPTTKDGTPLCVLEGYRKNPHAWVKLWKHHAAQPQAEKINRIARERGEKFLERYGGKISSEWFFPKIWQILEEAPDVYQAADRLIEAADWIVWQLTGVEKRNSCSAGYKAIWDPETGYPGRDFLKALDPRLENAAGEKLSLDVHPVGTRAGGLNATMAKLTGLLEGTPVAVGNVDAHVAVPAATVVDIGKMVMIMGTSVCHMVLGREKKVVEGMCGVVQDGIIEGFYGFEAGQCAVGDIFAWYVDNQIPLLYHANARKKKIDIHNILENMAKKIRPGQSGLLALDWWNGNRSVLVDADLSGVVLGYTLGTRPEEIYRALIEATAFGTNKIIKSFEQNGVEVKELYACGGLCRKNKLLMQIFADVTGREIKIADSEHTSALGSAMFGAVAAGAANGGYDTIIDAARNMAKVKKETYKPDSKNHEVYEKLFAEYEVLHDYFGRGSNDVMKRLKKMRGPA
jgi:L-ribulokinase